MNSGIYIIFNLINGHFYIGSTVNFYNRFKDHYNELKSNYHINNHLQNAWNKYGEENFEFIPIRFVESIKTKLLAVEQEYLDKYFESRECYNIAKDSTAPFLGKKHSEITKQKCGLACRGIKRSEETRKKMSLNNAKFMLGKKQSQDQIDKKSKEYKLISPSGEVIKIKNLRKFCRDNNLDRRCLMRVLNQEQNRKQHKGWRLYQI